MLGFPFRVFVSTREVLVGCSPTSLDVIEHISVIHLLTGRMCIYRGADLERETDRHAIQGASVHTKVGHPGGHRRTHSTV